MALNSLVLQRWQLQRLVNQATNRLHQLLLAVFPEGEAKYFNKLLELTSYYPTPQDILASHGLRDIENMSIADKEDIKRLVGLGPICQFPPPIRAQNGNEELPQGELF